MANAQVQFRIDEAIQRKASELCGRLGLDLTDYVRLGMNKMKQNSGVPFGLCQSVSEENSPFWEAVWRMQAMAEENGLSNMTLEEINAEIAAARAEMRAKEDSPLLEAMHECSRIAEANGIADMPPEEIDAEIAAVRAEMRAEEAAKNLAVMRQILRRAKANGTADMPLEELNAVISAARTE